MADSKLWIPANPVVNNGWKTFSNSTGYDSLNVETTSGTFTNGTCTYTDLLIINQYSTGNNLLSGKYYYKLKKLHSLMEILHTAVLTIRRIN